MSENLEKGVFLDQLKALCPTVDNLRLMLGAARHAFNRHSLAKLEEIARLLDDITLDLDPFFEQVKADLEKGSDAARPDPAKFQEILSHLEFMAHQIAGLADPIRRKSNQGAILSDKDFFHINDLFSRQTGLLRALVDIFHHDDLSLKAYLLNECQKLKDSCFQDEAELSTRMTESYGQTYTSSVYFDILDHFRRILAHLMDIVKILGG
jgi:Na+/phosphate symporter